MKKKEEKDDRIEVHIGMGEYGYITTKQLRYIIAFLIIFGIILLYLIFNYL